MATTHQLSQEQIFNLLRNHFDRLQAEVAGTDYEMEVLAFCPSPISEENTCFVEAIVKSYWPNKSVRYRSRVPLFFDVSTEAAGEIIFRLQHIPKGTPEAHYLWDSCDDLDPGLFPFIPNLRLAFAEYIRRNPEEEEAIREQLKGCPMEEPGVVTFGDRNCIWGPFWWIEAIPTDHYGLELLVGVPDNDGSSGSQRAVIDADTGETYTCCCTKEGAWTFGMRNPVNKNKTLTDPLIIQQVVSPAVRTVVVDQNPFIWKVTATYHENEDFVEIEVSMEGPPAEFFVNYNKPFRSPWRVKLKHGPWEDDPNN